ncbi:MAG: SAM-dependent DNA methyltransferase, partial [Tissierellia bacterium]|nr:SAM-dependent DNA methyltransferase [Tissierellia bacterium]
MALKKSDLYSKIWQMCDELRGGMDASQYKDYVLTLLFVKYVTDKSYNDPNALTIIPEGGSFYDMVKLKGNKDIGDGMNKIIHRLAEANDLVGVITLADFNDDDKLGRGKEKVDRLTKLIAIFENLNFSKNRADGDDIDLKAYEPAMRHLIDSYIDAEESKKISAFEESTLVELIVNKGISAIDQLPENIKKNKEATAATIENNVRRLIVEKSPTDPKYYERMSVLL